MSYFIQAHADKQLSIRQRSTGNGLMVAAIIIGAAVFIYGFYRLQTTPNLDSSMLLMAFGLCMAAGAGLLKNQRQLLPFGFELDNRKGRLRILEQPGGGCELGYAHILATGLLYSGRKQYQVKLQRSNGSQLALLTASFRKRAAELAQQINQHVANADRRSQHSPRLPDAIKEIRTATGRQLLWRDRSSRSIYLMVGLLVAGLTLGSLVLVQEWNVPADLQIWVLLFPGLYAVLAIYQLWRDWRYWHVLQIESGVLKAGRARFENKRKEISSLKSVKTIDLRKIVKIVYNLDLNVAMPILWLLDQDQWLNFKPEALPSKKRKRTQLDQELASLDTQKKKHRKILMRARRLRLPGLNSSAALALEAHLQKAVDQS